MKGLLVLRFCYELITPEILFVVEDFFLDILLFSALLKIIF
jgi:hypothetical protein